MGDLRIGFLFRILGLLSTCTIISGVVLSVFWRQDAIRIAVEHAAEDIRLILMNGEDHDEYQFTSRYECVVVERPHDKRPVSAGRCKDFEGIVEYLHGLQHTPAVRYKKIRVQNSNQSEWLMTAVSLIGRSGETVSGAVVAKIGPASYWTNRSMLVAWVLVGVNILLFTFLGFYRVRKSIIRPIERIAAITETFRGEKWWPQSSVQSLDDLGKLRFNLRQMLKRIEDDNRKLHDYVEQLERSNKELKRSKDLLVRSEKLASIGRLSAGLAHEIGNPLAIVQGYLELLIDANEREGQRRMYVKKSIDELGRVHNLIRQLLDFSRARDRKPQGLHVRNEVMKVVDLVAGTKPFDGMTIEVTYSDTDYLIFCDSELFRQVILNCLLNSRDAIRDSGNTQGRIHIKITESQEARDRVCIGIRDNGCGIPKDIVNTVFDPFYSTKEVGKGTGLGLYVAHTVMEEFGGRIWFDPCCDCGATIFLEFPVWRPEKQTFSAENIDVDMKISAEHLGG